LLQRLPAAAGAALQGRMHIVGQIADEQVRHAYIMQAYAGRCNSGQGSSSCPRDQAAARLRRTPTPPDAQRRTRPALPPTAASGAGRPRPIRAQEALPGPRLRWSGRYSATLSGAVCAGSNPAGGADQMTFEQNFGGLLVELQAADLAKRGRVPDLVPHTCPEPSTERGDPLVSGVVLGRPGARWHNKAAVASSPPRSGRNF
jgi:hypothetical protein